MRARLVSIAVVAALLCGCGAGPASIGAGPASTADPGLHGSATPPPATAAGVAQEIAARWSAPSAPSFARNLPIKFQTLDYTATVFSPGSSDGFTAFITTRRTTMVTTAS